MLVANPQERVSLIAQFASHNVNQVLTGDLVK
jgi:hypothetical protein